MKITVCCDACGASFSTGVENAGRKGKCPKCKAPVVVPEAPGAGESMAAAAGQDQPRGTARERLQQAREKGPLPKLGLAAGIVTILWGLATPFYCIFGVALLAVAYDAIPVLGLRDVLALEGLLALILLTGGIGLLLRQSWGWWVSIAAYVVGLLDLARLVVPLLKLVDWDHPEARGVVNVMFIGQGIPALIFLVLIVLLLLPRLRHYYCPPGKERERRPRKV